LSDYDADFTGTLAEAEKILEQAKSFVAKVEQVLTHIKIIEDLIYKVIFPLEETYNEYSNSRCTCRERERITLLITLIFR